MTRGRSTTERTEATEKRASACTDRDHAVDPQFHLLFSVTSVRSVVKSFSVLSPRQLKKCLSAFGPSAWASLARPLGLKGGCRRNPQIGNMVRVAVFPTEIRDRDDEYEIWCDDEDPTPC